MSEALLFAEHGENMRAMRTAWGEHVVYKNWFLFWHSEQLMCTTCSTHVLSLEFSCTEQSVVISWVSWCKNSFWHRFTCMQKTLFHFKFNFNGILFPKFFWPTVRKNGSSDRDIFLKFEAEGQEFAKNLSVLFSKQNVFLTYSWCFLRYDILEQF